MSSQNFVTRPGSQFVQRGTGAVERTVESKLQDVISVKDFGAVGDGVTNDGIAIQAAIDSGATRIEFPAGTYKLNTGISKALNGGALELIGLGNVIIDATSLGASTKILEISGNTSSSYSLGTSIAVGDTTFQVPAGLSLAAGDIVEFKSTDLWCFARSAYIKGELVEIRSVSGTTATIDGTFYDSYTAATTSLRKFSAPSVRIENLRLTRPSSDSTSLYMLGIELIRCKDSTLNRVEVEYSNQACFQLTNCYRTSVVDCVAVGNFVSAQGLDYGLVENSGMLTRVRGGSFVAGRHGITHGGTYPSRECLVDGAYIGNKTATTLAFDTHQNGENISVKNCTIYNGAYIGSINTTFSNNFIVVPEGMFDQAIQLNPAKSCRHITIADNNIESYNSNASQEGHLIKFFVSGQLTLSDTVTIDRLDITGNKIELNKTGNNNVYGIWLRGTNDATGAVTINTLNIAGNDIALPSGTAVAYFDWGGGLFTIAHLMLTDNKLNAVSRALLVADVPSKLITNRATISRNLFTITGASYSASVRFDGTQPVLIESNTFNGGVGLEIDQNGPVVIQNNIFASGTNSINFIGTPGITDAYINNNVDLSTNGMSNVGLARVFAMQAAGWVAAHRRLAWRSAVPTTGTWLRGDIVYNFSPTAGDFIGWVCTTAGTPGTWKTFGAISA